MGDSLFKIGRYHRVFLEIRNLGTNPYMSPYVETVSCVGVFFLAKILQKSSQGPTKVNFFQIKK